MSTARDPPSRAARPRPIGLRERWSLGHQGNGGAAGQPVLSTDYVESAELTATAPKQVVTYRINPKAKWCDDTPITWVDDKAQWTARNGTNPAYRVASTQGYDKVEGVARGSDDREVIVTFHQPYADWKGLFGLYPASTNRDPAVFNDGWKDKLLTTYQRPEIVAARSKLANFGAFGFASTIYEDIGCKKG